MEAAGTTGELRWQYNESGTRARLFVFIWDHFDPYLLIVLGCMYMYVNGTILVPAYLLSVLGCM